MRIKVDVPWARSRNNTSNAPTPNTSYNVSVGSNNTTFVDITGEDVRVHRVSSTNNVLPRTFGDGSEMPRAEADKQQEELKLRRQQDGKDEASAREEQQPHVEEASDEDEPRSDIGYDASDTASETSRTHRGSAHAQMPTEFFSRGGPRPADSSSSFIHYSGPIPNNAYVHAFFPAHSAAGWRGVGGGVGGVYYDYNTSGGYPYDAGGSRNYVNGLGNSWVYTGGSNGGMSSVSINSGNVSTVTVSNVGNDNSVIRYEVEEDSKSPGPKKKKSSKTRK